VCAALLLGESAMWTRNIGEQYLMNCCGRDLEWIAGCCGLTAIAMGAPGGEQAVRKVGGFTLLATP